MAMPRDRREVGQVLGERLSLFGFDPSVVVLGIANGHIQVARETARVLNAPLDVPLVRRLPAPGIHGYDLGVVASGGTRVFNEDRLAALRLTEAALEPVRKRALAELGRRERLLYHGERATSPARTSCSWMTASRPARRSTRRRRSRRSR